MTSARGLTDVRAKVSDLENYQFLGVSGAVTVTGVFLSENGDRLGESFSFSVAAASGSAVPESFRSNLGALMPPGANAAIITVSDNLYVDITKTAIADNSDFKTNYARFPILRTGTGHTLGRTVFDRELAGNVAAVAVSGAAMRLGGRLRPTITVDTAAYVLADGVGGIITMAGAVSYSGGSLLARDVMLTEAGGQAPALNLYLFRATPAGGTYTDNSALVIDASDLADQVGFIEVEADAWRPCGGTPKAANLSFEPQVWDCAATSLFMLIEARSAYDAVAATDLGMSFGVEER